MLTPREREILIKVTQGKSNKQIAYELGISSHTISNFTTIIYRKVNIPSSVNPRIWVAVHAEEILNDGT